MINLTKTYRLMWDLNTMIVTADPSIVYSGISLINYFTGYIESDYWDDIENALAVMPLIWPRPTDDEPGTV